MVSKEVVGWNILLYSRIKIPTIGYGRVNYGHDVHNFINSLNNDFTALNSAIEIGCRLFDTALACGDGASIGVLNFDIEQLNPLIAITGISPMVNQIRCNPTI